MVCLCSAHLHRVELADPASPSTLATCHDLYPFPILSHICLLLSCHHALFLPLRTLFAPFLACVVPSFYHVFYCILCPVPCLRLCLRKVAQVSLSAAEHPGHLISHTFPPRFAPFVPALFSSCLAFFFAAKKKTRRPCDSSPTLLNLPCSILLLSFLAHPTILRPPVLAAWLF